MKIMDENSNIIFINNNRKLETKCSGIPTCRRNGSILLDVHWH